MEYMDYGWNRVDGSYEDKIMSALQMWGQLIASMHGFHSPAFWNVALSHYVEMQTSSYMGIWISTSSRFLYNTRTAITLHVKVCSGFHTLVKLILYCYGCCWDKPIAFYGFRQASYSLRPKKNINLAFREVKQFQVWPNLYKIVLIFVLQHKYL